MLPFIRERRSSLVAYLVSGVFLAGGMAQAGPSPPLEISGEYQDATLDSISAPGSPAFISFTLSDGKVTSPSALSLFPPNTLNVSIVYTNSPPVNMGASFILEESPSKLIDYSIVTTSTTPNVEGTQEIGAQLKLISNTSGLGIILPNPGFLTLTWPSSSGVNLEPTWPSSFTGPVYFNIIQTPEPMSVVHLTWVGVIGAIGYWRRRCRRAMGPLSEV